MIFWLIFWVIIRVRQPMEDDLKKIFFKKKKKNVFWKKIKKKYFWLTIFFGHFPRKTTYGRRPD